MVIKGIKKYSDLLREVGRQLGEKDLYEFAKKEKANFSKMLKGQRPLKYEFIIPLERIFGVSLARLLDENSYKLPIENGNVIFNKGLRYYAKKDDYDLYCNELDLLIDIEGKPCLRNQDEFKKCILDYILEYGSTNGVKYLYNKYQLKYDGYRNAFRLSPENEIIWLFDESKITEFARLVANMNDVKMFNDIFDPYYRFSMNGHLDGTLYLNPEFYEIIIGNKELFDNLFVKRNYKYEFRDEVVEYECINPIINGVLNYSLKNLDKYKENALRILNFGMKENQSIISNNYEKKYNLSLYIDYVGALRVYKNNRPLGILITVEKDNMNTSDKEINKLISDLPYIEELRR